MLRYVPRDEFRAIVERHQGDKGVRKLSCWGQFAGLFFGQLTGQHSLRDLVTALDAGRSKLQQVGLGAVSRSTLADANRKRPQEIFGELFCCLYQRYEPDSILSFDRAYVDYHWFDQLHRQGVYFVTRQKRNARYRVLERRPVGPQPGVTSDQVIRLTGKAAQCLSTPLRRIGYRDPETRQFYVFLTNLFHLTAAEVAAIYKARWQIELFFKWVKQHLKLKSFLGSTANAVMTQVWVALCVYLLVAYVKFLLRPPGRLYEIFKRLQVTALEYLALGQVLAWEAKNGPKRAPKWRQRNLFGRRLKPLFVGR